MFIRHRASLILIVSAMAGTLAAGAESSVSRPQIIAPQIFEPGIISGPGVDGTPSFTPDGKTLFFTRSGATWTTILESHLQHGHWSVPQIAPFSGRWSDMQPVVSPDGSYILFASVRPEDPAATTSPTPRVAALWRVDKDKTASGWGEPVRLSADVNLGPQSFKPSIATDGSLYYMEAEKGKKFRIFCAPYVDGSYRKGEPLSFSDGATGDVDPEIAPDQSFLIFSSDGRNSGDTSHEHLYLVAHQDGRWGAVVPIHATDDSAAEVGNDNEAHLSRDGKTLYFSSDRTLVVKSPRTREEEERNLARLQIWDNGNYNPWFIPVGPWLEDAGKLSLQTKR